MSAQPGSDNLTFIAEQGERGRVYTFIPKKEVDRLLPAIKELVGGVAPHPVYEEYPIMVGYRNESLRLDIHPGNNYLDQVLQTLRGEVGLSFKKEI